MADNRTWQQKEKDANYNVKVFGTLLLVALVFTFGLLLGTTLSIGAALGFWPVPVFMLVLLLIAVAYRAGMRS